MDESPQEVSSSYTSADYMRFRTPEKPPRFQKLKRVLIRTIITILVVGAIAAVVVFVLKSRAEAPAPKAVTPAQQTPAQTTKDAPTTKTKRYESAAFDLSIDHPEDWAATEDTGKIILRSPAMELRNVSEKVVTGQVLLTIAQPGQPLPMFDAGNAMAVRDSKKISYTRPSSVQRGDTYLSFLQYAATTAPPALDGVYVTGDFGYLKDQAIPKVDVAKANPLITLTFVSCSSSNCSGTAAPLSVHNSQWDAATFTAPLETMLRSLTIN